MKNFKKYLCIYFLSLFFLIEAQAEIRLGSGMHTATAGRISPIIYGAWQGSSFGISALSVGVKNDLSYYSSYQINTFFYNFKPKRLFWGRTEAGIGWGGIYNTYGTQVAANTELENDSSFTTGPTIRALWYVADPVYMGFEVMFGVLSPFVSLSTLTSQDSSTFLIGFAL